MFKSYVSKEWWQRVADILPRSGNLVCRTFVEMDTKFYCYLEHAKKGTKQYSNFYACRVTFLQWFDDVIQNGRRFQAKSHGTSSVQILGIQNVLNLRVICSQG